MSAQLKAAKDTAWKWFSLYIRLRDADSNGIVKCCTCSTYKHYKDIAAGHYFTQGANKGLIFNERNCHPQEISCNNYKSGNLAVYTKFMIDKYGADIFGELNIQNALHRPYRESDYREIADKYRLIVNKLKKEKGIV